MRIEAYLRVLSDEATIRTIHKETNIPDASVRELKGCRAFCGFQESDVSTGTRLSMVSAGLKSQWTRRIKLNVLCCTKPTRSLVWCGLTTRPTIRRYREMNPVIR